MRVSILKSLALCGLCALFAGAGTAASAQSGYRHRPMQHGPTRAAILRQKAAYARAVANGRYRAAERAHLRAQAIRRHTRARRGVRRGYGY